MSLENRRYLLGIFEAEEDIMGATRSARERGLKIVDVYAPYAVHGLEHAMGLPATKISLITLVLGLVGAGLKIWFEYWTTAIDWPINVGGKPWDSFPAFFPVTFEVMVLSAGIGTVIALLVSRRLVPGRKADLPVPGVTDDRFALVIEETDASFDKEATEKMFAEFNAVEIVERIEQEPTR
jgi:hypothetical protein